LGGIKRLYPKPPLRARSTGEDGDRGEVGEDEETQNRRGIKRVIKKGMIQIKKENEIISLKSNEVGSIKHFVSINDGRCTFYTNEYMRETCKPSLNPSATYNEVEKLRDVFNEILRLMRDGIPPKKKATKEKHPSGKNGFIITLPDGTSISVLDFADVMKSAPKELRECVYTGWEAWDGEKTYRGKTFEEVEQMLKKVYTINY
jgi:hypothetical protein